MASDVARLQDDVSQRHLMAVALYVRLPAAACFMVPIGAITGILPLLTSASSSTHCIASVHCI
jgi:hypothetical protein